MKEFTSSELLAKFKRVIPTRYYGDGGLTHLLHYEEPAGYIIGPKGRGANVYVVGDGTVIIAGGDAFGDWIGTQDLDYERDRRYDHDAEKILKGVENEYVKHDLIKTLLSDYLVTESDKTQARAIATALRDACLDMDGHDYDEFAEAEIDELAKEIVIFKQHYYPLLDAVLMQFAGVEQPEEKSKV